MLLLRSSCFASLPRQVVNSKFWFKFVEKYLSPALDLSELYPVYASEHRSLLLDCLQASPTMSQRARPQPLSEAHMALITFNTTSLSKMWNETSQELLLCNGYDSR